MSAFEKNIIVVPVDYAEERYGAEITMHGKLVLRSYATYAFRHSADAWCDGAIGALNTSIRQLMCNLAD